MAKFKIQAGAEIDVLSAGELRDELSAFGKAWVQEAMVGDRHVRFATWGLTDGSGNVIVGDRGDRAVGPAEGFVWAVKRLALTAGAGVATPTVGLYVNSADTTNLVHPALPAYLPLDSTQLVLKPGETLIASGTAVADKKVWITGEAREVPVSLAYRL